MMKSVLTYTVLVVTGLIVAVVGTSAHRAYPYVGLVAAVALVLAASVFARSWKEWGGIGAFAAGWLVLTSFFSVEGPGGSELILADHYGIAWLLASTLGIVAVCLVPRRVLMGSDDVAG